MKTVSDAIHLILISSLAAAVTITVGYYFTITESQRFVVPVGLRVTSNTNVTSSLYVTTPGGYLTCGL